LNQPDAVEIALVDPEPVTGVNAHQSHFMAESTQRQSQVEPTVVGPTLPGLVMDDEQNLQLAAHLAVPPPAVLGDTEAGRSLGAYGLRGP
jgi:hypothetical protein